MLCAPATKRTASAWASGAEGRERREDEQRIANPHTNSGVCAGKAAGTVSPGAAASGGVAEHGFR